MKKILIVEDSGLVRFQLNSILKAMGFEVFQAINGKQVINNLFHDTYNLKDMDLMILDLYLEDIYGAEIIKTVKNNYPQLPIIILSSENKQEKILECIDLGVEDYILKPIDKDNFIRRINKVLNNNNISQSENELTNHDEDHFHYQLLNEIDRAIRGKTNFSVIKYVFNEEVNLDNIYQITKQSLRAIDEVFLINNELFLICLYTDKPEIIVKKLETIWKENKYLKNNPDVYQVIFPQDLENDKLIEENDKLKIKDILLEKLQIEKTPPSQ